MTGVQTCALPISGCGERVKQEYVCPKHGKVDRSEMAKGYPVDRSTTIELEPAELKALEAVGNDEISLVEFVPAAAVDPIYIDRSYYLGPDRGAGRAYRLLRDALDDAELVGIARYEARGKAYVMMVRPFETGLAMHQLRYADEVKPWAAIHVDDLAKPTASELDLAHKLVAQLARNTFDPTQFTDDVKVRVEKLLEDKIKNGETIVAPEQGGAPPAVADLMAALRASLESTPPPAKHERAPARRPRREAGHRPRVRAHGARTKRTHA